MLDIGISSTRHIARFWGIVGSGEVNTVKPAPANHAFETAIAGAGVASMRPATETSADPLPVSSKSRRKHRPSQLPNSTWGIRKITEDALRTLGLMP